MLLNAEGGDSTFEIRKVKKISVLREVERKVRQTNYKISVYLMMEILTWRSL